MKKLIAFILVALSISIGLFVCKKAKNEPGVVIILNGPSSVGKSSIQKEVQTLFRKPYLRMGLDDLAFLPPQYISINGPIPPADQGIYLKTTEQNGHPIVSIHYGSAGQKMMRGIHRTFAAFAGTGNNIIVDYIAYDRSWLADLAYELKDFTVYFIGVHAPLEIIEERERQRGNRLLGHARSHYETVHSNITYDLDIDTSTITPEAAAHIIQEYIVQHPNPHAFKGLNNKP